MTGAALGTLDGRFALLNRVAQGGMGVVYRGQDLSSGLQVAVKLLIEPEADTTRFVREARVLEQVRHPAVVEHIAHGRDAVSGAYLVLEWVPGETLRQRLHRKSLTTTEAVRLLRALADGVGALHQQGLVHRDLKPSNVMLEDSDPNRPKLLDFGLTRTTVDDEPLTRVGTLVGTPGYMAPEQARGDPNVDARADVFALGTLLFECITGRPAFPGDDPWARLAKTVLASVPALAELLPDTSQELSLLVASMLAKDPAARPRDATEVARRLEHVSLAAGVDPPYSGLGGRGRSVSTVLVVTAADPPDRVALGELAAEHGAAGDPLADGSFLLSWSSGENAQDSARRAARAGLAIRESGVTAGVCIVTSLSAGGESSERADVIDAVTRLLSDSPRPQQIVIDSATASLLGDEFTLEPTGASFVLRAEHVAADSPRMIRGRSTPTVGRQAEQRVLDAIAKDCFETPAARAVVLVGPAGIGKSRLGHELVSRLRMSYPKLEIWRAAGDSLRAGAAFGFAASALRSRVGASERDAPEHTSEQLRSFVEAQLPPPLHARAKEFLAEMCQVPMSGQVSAPLETARQDPAAMLDQIKRIWVELFRALGERSNVVFVCEDVHWADSGSLALMDALLAQLEEQPVLVVGLARPEVHERFPELWAKRGSTEIGLGPLTDKAARELVCAVFGSLPEGSDTVVKRAGGSPLFLEELLRQEPSAAATDLPVTILATLERRLAAQEPEARRVLRAGAIFGTEFPADGVRELLASASFAASVDRWLEVLVARDLIVPIGSGILEFRFRHALVREAAYALLDTEDRARTHRAAGAWLEQQGSRDSLTLAEHFERGGQAKRAATHWARAARWALFSGDAQAVERWAERAVRAGITGAERGELEMHLAHARTWMGAQIRAREAARAALELLPEGSGRWCDAAVVAAEVEGTLGDAAGVQDIWRRVAVANEHVAPSALAVARARVVTELRRVGDMEGAGVASAIIRREEVRGDDLRGRAFLERLDAEEAFYAGRLADQLRRQAVTAELFEQAGDERWAARELANLGYTFGLVGSLAQSEQTLQKAIGFGRTLGMEMLVRVCEHNLGMTIARLGRLDEAREIELRASDFLEQSRLGRLAGFSRLYLARIELWRGDTDAALAQAERALELFSRSAPIVVPYVSAVIAEAHRLSNRAELAVQESERALRALASHGSTGEGESFIRLTGARALHTAGDLEAARAAIQSAREYVLTQAATLPEDVKRGFCSNIEEHKHTLTFAAEW